MIKAIIFDFDNTLCNRNVFHYDINYVKKYPLDSFFNDYENVAKLLKYFKKHDILLFIASFGRYEIIKYLIDKAFPDTFDAIYTPDNLKMHTVTRFFPDNCPCISDKYKISGYSKNYIITLISNKYVIDFSEMLFFDDDNANTDCAKLIKVNVYNNNTPLNSRIIKTVFVHYNYSKKYVLVKNA